MVWSILGAVSLFFNIAKTDKLVSNNSEFISTNKTHLVENTTTINNSNFSSPNTNTRLLFIKRVSYAASNLLKDTVYKNEKSRSSVHPTSNPSKKIEIVTYRIYFNGTIEKHIPKVVAEANKNKYKYEYFPKKGTSIDLGTYKIKKTIAYKGKPGEYVNLINLETVPKYFKKKEYQYHFNIDSRRSFVNEKTLASFFGAMLDVNYLDISCNGFSHEDGSSKPSRSHINGNNGDFKYLRATKELRCGPGTSLNISKSADLLDYSRQNKWNDALYKFGWKKMLGWTYTIKRKTNKLHHIDHKTTNHYHHLHVQKYEPDFKEIKQ
ncbi:hypothetical protein [Flavobacterium sp.]|uniref:hypothetical protein n=1 Tax=Flavobacterium sp. TaxID=239 RepID=UPI002620BDAC|nr:hypothetical protein [Flavobacterium sp.]MDG2432705.1 hypothetical protein [Flavobacterium sp.]